MARSHQNGPLAGNYVTLAFMAKQVTAISQGSTPKDRIPLVANFRASQICYDARGTAAVATAFITTFDVGGTVISSGTPKIIAPGSLDAREWGRTVSPTMNTSSDGSGEIPAGGLIGWVTGRFVDHPTLSGRVNAETGQAQVSGPALGFLDNWPLINLLPLVETAWTEVCSFIAPNDGRIHGISFNLIGGTGTGTKKARVKNNGDIVGTSADLDASENFPIAANGCSNRDVTKGDEVTLEIDAPAGTVNTIPISTFTANVLVEATGHVAASEADD